MIKTMLQTLLTSKKQSSLYEFYQILEENRNKIVRLLVFSRLVSKSGPTRPASEVKECE
jgi:hypothetical protein